MATSIPTSNTVSETYQNGILVDAGQNSDRVVYGKERKRIFQVRGCEIIFTFYKNEKVVYNYEIQSLKET